MEEIRAKDLGLGYEPHFYHSKANALSHITKNPIFEQGGSTFFKHSVLFRNDKTKCSEIGRLIIGTSELRFKLTKTLAAKLGFFYLSSKL